MDAGGSVVALIIGKDALQNGGKQLEFMENLRSKLALSGTALWLYRYGLRNRAIAKQEAAKPRSMTESVNMKDALKTSVPPANSSNFLNIDGRYVARRRGRTEPLRPSAPRRDYAGA
jgi:hypothetical protein